MKDLLYIVNLSKKTKIIIAESSTQELVCDARILRPIHQTIGRYGRWCSVGEVGFGDDGDDDGDDDDDDGGAGCEAGIQ